MVRPAVPGLSSGAGAPVSPAAAACVAAQPHDEPPGPLRPWLPSPLLLSPAPPATPAPHLGLAAWTPLNIIWLH